MTDYLDSLRDPVEDFQLLINHQIDRIAVLPEPIQGKARRIFAILATTKTLPPMEWLEWVEMVADEAEREFLAGLAWRAEQRRGR